MDANNLQSYYVAVHMKIAGTNISSEAPRIDLKDPEYRFYTSPNAYCPPGTASVWGQQGQQAATTQSPQQQPAVAPQVLQPAQAGGDCWQGVTLDPNVGVFDPSTGSVVQQVPTYTHQTQVGAGYRG